MIDCYPYGHSNAVLRLIMDNAIRLLKSKGIFLKGQKNVWEPELIFIPGTGKAEIRKALETFSY